MARGFRIDFPSGSMSLPSGGPVHARPHEHRTHRASPFTPRGVPAGHAFRSEFPAPCLFCIPRFFAPCPTPIRSALFSLAGALWLAGVSYTSIRSVRRGHQIRSVVYLTCRHVSSARSPLNPLQGTLQQIGNATQTRWPQRQSRCRFPKATTPFRDRIPGPGSDAQQQSARRYPWRRHRHSRDRAPVSRLWLPCRSDKRSRRDPPRTRGHRSKSHHRESPTPMRIPSFRPMGPCTAAASA